MRAFSILSDIPIEASAPGRAGIIGNPTDMYGGSVISCSVKGRAYCSLSASHELLVDVSGSAINLSDIRQLALDGSRFDIVKAAVRALEIDPADGGFSVSVWTEIPEQAGLAGSTAMLTCVVACLLDYLGLGLDRYELAEVIHSIEADVMRTTCGYQDHYMSVFGGLNYMDFRCKEWMRQTPDEPYATVEPLVGEIENLPMILAHTGVKRFSGGVHKTLRDRWLEGEQKVVDAYIRIGELCRMGKKALLRGDWKELGCLMNENHAIQRDLGGSGESNEALIQAALANGAYGAKLAGAGGGGTIIAVAEDPARIAKALKDAGAESIIELDPGEGLVMTSPGYARRAA